ncbi:cell adhesion molecule 2-like [Girardinichthys multiradiatus]|uniref:cell adhesion molecule 2-like n=1 Tax=Girardinichthys multiradiatus TaxID=208333 RepID=UPI001FACF313|nr:cell adhesion molecule 2-like [Girardinichthys multiradiatus]
MNAYTTPSPLTQTSTDTFPTFSDLVTKIGKKDIYSSTEDFVALVGGIITVVLLVFLCTIAILLWCLSRQKGSYVTNETDDYDEIDNEDDESVGSDVALQSKEPLKTVKED